MNMHLPSIFELNIVPAWCWREDSQKDTRIHRHRHIAKAGEGTIHLTHMLSLLIIMDSPEFSSYY